MKYKNYFLTSALVFIFSFTLMPIKTHALSMGGIGIRPSYEAGSRDWFVYELGPGESKEDYVIIFNNTDEEKSVLLDVVDSEASNIGAFALTSSREEQKGIGKWIELEEHEFTLEAFARKKIKFTIAIPEDADTGEHSGAITVQSDRPRELKGFSGALVNTRVGARVYNTVPGEIIKKLSISSFELEENLAKQVYILHLKAKNEGNVSLRPDAQLFIDGWGILKLRNNVIPEFFNPQVFQKEWGLLRGHEVSTNWQWPIPYAGKYNFTVTLTYENTEGEQVRLQTQTLTVTIIPWRDLGIVGGVLLLLLLIIIILIVARKMKYSGRGWQSYKVKASDNIITLAQQYNISWKFLAKVNRIKKPYSLISGKTILIPSTKPIKKTGEEKIKPPQEAKKPRGDRFRKILIVVIALLTTAILVLAVMLFVKSINKQANTVSPITITPPPITTQKATTTDEISDLDFIAELEIENATSTETATSTQEAESETDRKEITISVLNGSGIAGIASKISDRLKEEDFVQITPGNADSYEYQNLIINYQPEYKTIAEDISLILSDEYPESILKKVEEQKEDIIVIIGKKEEL